MEPNLQNEYKPLSPWAYWGLSILYTIPIVGFIFMIVFSISKANINRRNFTRSYWCWYILVGIAVLILAVTGVLGDLIYYMF